MNACTICGGKGYREIPIGGTKDSIDFRVEGCEQCFSTGDADAQPGPEKPEIRDVFVHVYYREISRAQPLGLEYGLKMRVEWPTTGAPLDAAETGAEANSNVAMILTLLETNRLLRWGLLDLVECERCGGTGKVERAVLTDGATIDDDLVDTGETCLETCDGPGCGGKGKRPADRPKPLATK